MSPQKNKTITRQEQEQHTVGEDSPWILERAMTTLRMESLNASIATSTGIWLKNVRTRRKRKKPESISNATKRDTLQKTAKGNSQ